jgi:dynein heavy chain
LQAGEYDEFEVMRQNSPWPKRNHNCFYYLNVFMERCNDVLDLVQTMRHFQILSKTVSIGGSDNYTMDILAQEIHSKYVNAISEFQENVTDVMSFEQQSQNFEISFFNLRTTVKVTKPEFFLVINSLLP